MTAHLKRSGIQLCYPFEERRLRNEGRFTVQWQPPYLIQPKLNGERCRVIVEFNRALLLSSTEEFISSVPHINDAALYLPVGEYDAELYRHGYTFSQIHSIVSRTVNPHPDYLSMQLHLFDIINDQPQHTRIKQLNNLVVPDCCIKKVDTDVAWNLSDVMHFYDKYIDNGYEGFVIRHIDGSYLRRRTPCLMKFKPKETDIYTIQSVYEAISEDGTPKGLVGGFNCIDDMGTEFSVGAGKLSHDERANIWKHYQNMPNVFKGRMLEIEYQTMSDSKKVPLFSRAVRIL